MHRNTRHNMRTTPRGGCNQSAQYDRRPKHQAPPPPPSYSSDALLGLKMISNLPSAFADACHTRGRDAPELRAAAWLGIKASGQQACARAATHLELTDAL